MVNNETIAYELDKSFASDPATKSLNHAAWLEMAWNWIGSKEDVDFINEKINEVIEYIENDEATNAHTYDDEDDPAYAAVVSSSRKGHTLDQDWRWMARVNQLTTTTETMQAMDVLSNYCLEKGFEKKISDLAQIELDLIRKRKERATVQSSLTLYFCSAIKGTS